MPSRRLLRINQLLRHEIAELLRREINDATITESLISITEVDTSPDLRTAKVYFSVYGGEDEIREAGAHLARAARFLRHNLKERLDLRHVPDLQFVFDPSLEHGARIMQLIRSIEQERQTAPEQDPEAGG